jgi:hypothetical protein
MSSQINTKSTVAELKNHLREQGIYFSSKVTKPELQKLAGVPISPPRKVHQKKDPNAVKRPASAFILFCNANREAMKAKHPEMKLSEITSELGKAWKALPPKKQQPFKTQYATAQSAYKAVQDANKKPSYPLTDYQRFVRNHDSWNSLSESQKKTFKDYFTYIGEMHLAERWKNLPADERKKYHQEYLAELEKAKAIHAEYSKKHPECPLGKTGLLKRSIKKSPTKSAEKKSIKVEESEEIELIE